MVQAERIIAAYYCSEEKLPGNRCVGPRRTNELKDIVEEFICQ